MPRCRVTELTLQLLGLGTGALNLELQFTEGLEGCQQYLMEVLKKL